MIHEMHYNQYGLSINAGYEAADAKRHAQAVTAALSIRITCKAGLPNLHRTA
jgi:hypothetical protein